MFSPLLAVLLSPAVLASDADFEDPVRLEAGGQVIRIEGHGYASPCLADMDGDGDKDLLVGQFDGGQIQLFHNQGDGTFAEGEWILAGNQTAEVPGVW